MQRSDDLISIRTHEEWKIRRKMEECRERMDSLRRWLLDNTCAPAAEFDERLAEYHAENYRYDVLLSQLNTGDNRRKPIPDPLPGRREKRNEK